MTDDRGRRTDDRGRRSEDRGQMTEDGGRRSEDRGQMTEDGGQRLLNLELGMRNAENKKGCKAQGRGLLMWPETSGQ